MEMNNLKPNQQRAKIAIFLKWIGLFLECISLIYFLISILFIDYLITNDSLAAFYINISTPLIVSTILITIISMIALILWLYRAYYNLQQLGVKLSYGVGWAVGCWFVPIINLYRPCGLIQDLYEKTNDYFKENYQNINTRLSFNFVGLWWISWIANSILAFYTFYSDNTSIIIISSIIGMVSTLLTIKLIKSYSKIELILYKGQLNKNAEILETE